LKTAPEEPKGEKPKKGDMPYDAAQVGPSVKDTKYVVTADWKPADWKPEVKAPKTETPKKETPVTDSETKP